MTDHDFSIRVRIYWEDTDAGGIVYHGQYLNFAERARTEWVRSRGIESQKKYSEENGMLFVVRNININYKMPAVLDDVLNITCSVFEQRNASIVFKQNIMRDDVMLAEIFVTLACINTQGRAVRMPSEMKQYA